VDRRGATEIGEDIDEGYRVGGSVRRIARRARQQRRARFCTPTDRDWVVVGGSPEK
jgi:hypothetical protein